MRIDLNRTENLLFSLLKASLTGKADEGKNWASYTDEDWKSCYQLAVKHGVMAVAWDGIMTLPPQLHPPKGIKLPWGLAVQKYEERYRIYCRTAEELSSFYAENGISMIQLKGVGLSPYYPVPSHREGGDIDIYTYSSDRSRLSDSEANRLADKLMQDKGIEVEEANRKHSNFYYKGISIENHKSFLDLDVNRIADYMDNLLLEIMDPREVGLCDSKYRVSVPSPEFNAVFLSFHAGQHYCSGLRVHHLFDWACLLRKYGLPLSSKVYDRKFLNFVYALTELCNILLGTEVDVPADEKLTREVYEQLMRPRFSGKAPENRIGIILYKTAKFFYTHYKSSRIFSKPLYKVIWNSITFHIRNPKTIFMTSTE